MNRLAKIFCWLVVAEMTAVAILTLASRWPDIAHYQSAISGFDRRKIFYVCFLPGWAALAIVLMERKLRPKGMTLSADHRRFIEAALVAACLLGAAMQVWSAAIFVLRDPTLLHVSPQGAAMLLGGGFFAVYGNAAAKLDPPTGLGAPEPGVWIRDHLRGGWTIVLLGIVLMAGAFAPPIARVAITLLAVPVALALLIAQRRMRGPRAPV